MSEQKRARTDEITDDVREGGLDSDGEMNARRCKTLRSCMFPACPECAEMFSTANPQMFLPQCGHSMCVECHKAIVEVGKCLRCNAVATFDAPVLDAPVEPVYLADVKGSLGASLAISETELQCAQSVLDTIGVNEETCVIRVTDLYATDVALLQQRRDEMLHDIRETIKALQKDAEARVDVACVDISLLKSWIAVLEDGVFAEVPKAALAIARSAASRYVPEANRCTGLRVDGSMLLEAAVKHVCVLRDQQTVMDETMDKTILETFDLVALGSSDGIDKYMCKVLRTCNMERRVVPMLVLLKTLTLRIMTEPAALYPEGDLFWAFCLCLDALEVMLEGIDCSSALVHDGIANLCAEVWRVDSRSCKVLEMLKERLDNLTIQVYLAGNRRALLPLRFKSWKDHPLTDVVFAKTLEYVRVGNCSPVFLHCCKQYFGNVERETPEDVMLLL